MGESWKHSLGLVNVDMRIRHLGGNGWEAAGYRGWNSWEGTLSEMLKGVLQAERNGW